MKRIALLYAVIVVLTAVMVAMFWRVESEKNAPPVAPSGVVIRVVDGNTVRLLDGRTVRIAHIEAPALDQPGGVAAANALESVVLDRRVVLVQPHRDGENTWRATVLIEGERDAGMLMLKRGFAWHTDHDQQAMPEAELYGFMQEEAKQDRRGLWRDRRPVPPWEWRRMRVSCGGDQRPETMTIKTVAV